MSSSDDIWGRLNRALLDPVWGSSDWLQNFQAFMEIEVKPEIERLRRFIADKVDCDCLGPDPQPDDGTMCNRCRFLKGHDNDQ